MIRCLLHQLDWKEIGNIIRNTGLRILLTRDFTDLLVIRVSNIMLSNMLLSICWPSSALRA